jgi:hypothetical protein
MLLDYSTSRPGISLLKSAGVTAVGRYIGWDSVSGFHSIGKNLTRAEAQRYLDAGIDIFLAFEYAADAAAHGADQGRKDGNLAMSQLAQLGAPPSMGVYFAVDYDIPDFAPHLPDTPGNAMAKLGPIGQYFAAIKALKHSYEIGCYGGYYAVKRCFDAGLTTLGWQTVAWSGGQRDDRAQIYQLASGAPVVGADIDVREHTVSGTDYGQWPRPKAAPKPPTTPTNTTDHPAPEEEYMAIVLDYLTPNAAVVLPVPAGKTKAVFYADSGFGTGHTPVELRVGYVPKGKGFNSDDSIKPTWDNPAVVDLGGSTKVTIGRVDAGNTAVTVDFS